MTNLEALQAVLHPIAHDPHQAVKALLDQDISEISLYTRAAAVKIDTAALSVLESLLSAPNVSEGGYSISYDRRAIMDRINMIAERSGLKNPVPKPKIQDKTSLW